MNPRAVFPVGIPGAEAPGPAQRAAASGLSPFRESLATAAGLVRQSPDAPLGFALSGSADWSLARAFTRAPPARFRESTSRPKPAAPRSLDQLQLGPSRTGEPVVGRTTLTGFSHRTNPAAFKPSNPSGLLGSPCAASRITADCPTLFGRPPRSTAAARALIWGADSIVERTFPAFCDLPNTRDFWSLRSDFGSLDVQTRRSV
jgi:hypothetical protein